MNEHMKMIRDTIYTHHPAFLLRNNIAYHTMKVQSIDIVQSRISALSCKHNMI